MVRFLRLGAFFRGRALLVSVLSLMVLLQGCAPKTTETLSQPQLQALVNDSFLSPQIRSLDIVPGVGIQLYLKTPTVTVRDDGQPLAFSMDGFIDADFLGSTVTERLPIQVSGVANLIYDNKEQAFFFRDIQLKEARLEMDVVMFETLIIEQLKKAIASALTNMAIIPLDEASPLLKSIAGRAVSVSTVNGELLLTFKEAKQ